MATYVNPEVVDLLKGLLKQAKAGYVSGIVIMTLDPDEGVQNHWAGSAFSEVFKTLGGLHVLIDDYKRDHVE